MQIISIAGTTQSDLARLLRYDSETGKLFWLPRSEDMFAVRGSRSAAGSCSQWNRRYAGREAFTALTHGYLHGNLFNIRVRAHRVAFCLYHGKWPEVVDHINGDRADNRICNLREVTTAINNRNMAKPSNNTSGVAGVAWDKSRQKWLVRVSRKSLGRFDRFEDAVAARGLALRNHSYHPNHGRIA